MIGSSRPGLALLDALLERHRRGDLERQLVRVDGVERAVVERRLEVRQRVAGDHALGRSLADALLDAREEARGHRAADDLLGELDAAARVRLDLEPDVAEHAVAAGLLLVPALDLGRAADRLACRGPAASRHDRRAELALEPLADDRDVGLAGRARAAARRSSERSTRADGSSSSIRWRAAPILSRSALVWGSIATGSVGCGKSSGGRSSGSPWSTACRRSRSRQLRDRADLAGLELADRLLVLAVEQQQPPIRSSSSRLAFQAWAWPWSVPDRTAEVGQPADERVGRRS